jgi:hypothetical protein
MASRSIGTLAFQSFSLSGLTLSETALSAAFEIDTNGANTPA